MKEMKKTWRGAAIARAAAAALVVAVALAAQPTTTGAVLVDRVVAVVNGDVITLSELRDEMKRIHKEPGDPREESAVLRDMIEQRLIEQEAEKQGVTVTEKDIDLAIEGVKIRFKMDDEALGKALKEQGVTMAEFREQWRRQLLNQKLMRRVIGGSIAVTDDEIRKEYELKYGTLAPERETRLSHILVKIGSSEDEARQKALEILERARKGESFSKLAKEFSDDPVSASKGGDLGYFKPGDLAPPLEEAVAEAKVGEIVGPVRSAAGFHIMKVTDIKRTESSIDPTTREQIREELYQKKVKKALEEWVSQIRKKAYVEVKL